MVIRRTTILLTILILVIGIQFIQPVHNYSKVKSNSALDRLYEIPDSINHLLKIACNDCHSNNTRYPWYSTLQPLGWMVDHHIRKGKENLNFDEFANFSERTRRNKLKAIVNQIRDGEMPLKSYTWMHLDAQLSESEKQMLINWFTK